MLNFLSFVVLILSLFLDEILMPGSSTNYAKCQFLIVQNAFVAGFFYFVDVRSMRWCGGIVVRGCASFLLGSYIHQELI